MENESFTEKSAVDSNNRSIKTQKSSKSSFIICGHNGASLVEPVLLDLGWTKLTDKTSDDFKLKWTELVCQVNYGRFREGEQLVNHIPNCGLITNKLGLLTSLRSYDKSLKEKKKSQAVELNDFVPETYIIDDVRERDQFFSIYKDGEIWINKPTGLNQGKGISLIRDIEEFKKELDGRDNVSRSTMSGVKARIVQRYIHNPLLLEGRKFDIRCYMLIACTSPFVVMYCPGYIRLSMNAYSNEDKDLVTHLTNQFIQKKSPKYQEVKENTIWSMEKFSEYINENFKSFPTFKDDWAKTVLENQMQQIMLYVFNSVKNRLATRLGFFEIYGFDFMIDNDLKIWLIEVNVNPAMHVNCALLKEILPPMIEEVLLLALECFEKCTKSKKPLLPLEKQRLFTILYAESASACKSRLSGYSSLKTWIAPRYRSSSHSPNRSKGDEKPQGETSQNAFYLSKSSNSRPSNNVSTNLSQKDTNLRSTGSSKESDSFSKFERSPYLSTYQVQPRSRSFNPFSYEKKEKRDRSNSIEDNSMNNNVGPDKSHIQKSHSPSINKTDRISTSINFNSLTLDPHKARTDLLKSYNANVLRKTQSVRTREPAPISLVQVVTGKMSNNNIAEINTNSNKSSSSNKVKVSQVVVKKRPKVYDRSS